MALVRDLFGLATEDGAFGEPGLTEDEELAEVRELRRR